MFYNLNTFSRKALHSYMIDVHGFSNDDCKEWSSKADLIGDIERNGWSQDCHQYLAN